MFEFKAWPKIPRLENEKYYITEKLDGTNACVIITEKNEVGAQSRTRLITPDNDNYGFAKWVEDNREELVKLGPGHHYGEWWGLGIQRGYGLEEKRFSLFNTKRWEDAEKRPSCCHIVPSIQGTIEEAKQSLLTLGSLAAPGWTRPEGLVVYNCLAGSLYKVIIDK